MAREIKIVACSEGYNVRGIQDACAKNEVVHAARWQDGTEVKVFSFHPEAKEYLDQQVGYNTVENSNAVSFWNYLQNGWGDDIAEKAFR